NIMQYIIKNKNDAKAFLGKFTTASVFLFRDSSISMVGGGATRITYDGEDYHQFSSGQNWSDQRKEVISEPISFVYRHRKDIRDGEFIA
ncbi:MAG: hypothetical protein JW697_09690, partial [Kosmotogaceae bacterium]|nr:hypothetical protein [Kosmotogaceae bacterium]